MVVIELLLNKMSDLQNYSRNAGMLLQAYLSDGRTQFVKCVERGYSAGSVTSGVLQGYVLGPLLFISYIDSVSGVIRYCQFHIYADELQIYGSSDIADL
jgi:hypothetical protein